MSPFAEALKRLLNDTIDYTREDWVEYLFVLVVGERDYKRKRLNLIESWLRDEALPSPSQLYMIWLVTSERYTSPATGPSTEAFRQMANRRATEVSPLGNRMLPTVWEYMKRPIFCELSSKLAKLSPEEKGKLLETIYPPPGENTT